MGYGKGDRAARGRCESQCRGRGQDGHGALAVRSEKEGRNGTFWGLLEAEERGIVFFPGLLLPYDDFALLLRCAQHAWCVCNAVRGVALSLLHSTACRSAELNPSNLAMIVQGCTPSNSPLYSTNIQSGRTSHREIKHPYAGQENAAPNRTPLHAQTQSTTSRDTAELRKPTHLSPADASPITLSDTPSAVNPKNPAHLGRRNTDD